MNISAIDKLIIKCCPDGVDYKQLDEICYSLKKNTLKQTDLIKNGIYPVVNSGKELYGYYSSYNNEGDAFVIASRGEYAGFVTYMKDKFWAGGLCYPYTSKCNMSVLTKFIFYYLKNKERFIMDTLVARGGIPALNKGDIDKFKIPVPPLPVQEEIVKILDTYSELEAELESKLEAELDARKKQYEYHLNQLLSFDKNDKDIKFMPLCEACTVKRGIRLIKNDLDSNSQYAVYQNSLKPLGYYNQFNYEGDTTFVISAGAAGDIGYSSVPFWAADDCLCVRATEILNNKYIYYVLKTKQNLLYSKVRKGAVPRLSRKVVEQIIIPIPPLMEQERIVSILDEFNKLTNEISDSLQAEITARKKQYEYYRNKLLTFKEAV